MPAQALAGISRGPYLQDVRTDRITVAAETDDESACTLEWGYWGEGFGREKPMNTDGYHNEVVLDGLEPSTCYNYRIVCGLRQSPDSTFCTAPLPGESFSFVICGDTRADHPTHAAVARAIHEEGVDFYINTGDLVSDGAEEEDWDHFFEAERELLLDTPFYPVVGNHDDGGDRMEIYTRLFAPPSEISESEVYYTFAFGNARFIVIDNQFIGLGRPKDHSKQGDWFAGELEAASQDESVEHIFVVLHDNMYSVKGERGGDEGIRQWRDEMLEKGVDYVFSGHDHHYVRGAADNGLPFLISGGGGASLYNIRDGCLTTGEPIEAEVFGWLPEPGFNPFTVYYSFVAYHYVRVDINGPHFSACAKQVFGTSDKPGETFDCFTYAMASKPPEPGCSCHGLYGPGWARGSTSGVSFAGLFFLVFLLKFIRLSNRNSRA
jgi:3',5'-cyclic AMP phosphodiesterase CpdA